MQIEIQAWLQLSEGQQLPIIHNQQLLYEGINRPWHWQGEIRSQKYLDESELSAWPVSLCLGDAEQQATREWPGQLEHVQLIEQTPGHCDYQVTFQHPLLALHKEIGIRSFQNIPLDELSKQLLQEISLPFPLQIRIEAQSLPLLEWAMQNNETTLEFLQRLWTQAGWVGRSLVHENTFIWALTDDPKSWQPSDLPWLPKSDLNGRAEPFDNRGRIWALTQHYRAQSQGIVFTETPLFGTANPWEIQNGEDSLVQRHIATGATTFKELSQQAERTFGALEREANLQCVEGDATQLQTGQSLRLSPDSDNNVAPLQLTTLAHTLPSKAGHTGLHRYTVQAQGSEATTKLSFRPERNPYSQPLQRAFVEGEAQQVQLDEQGRYRITLWGDIQQARSSPLAALQLGGGDQTGSHLPYGVGSEIAFFSPEGQATHSTLMGASPNVPSPALLNEENPTLHQWRSRSGHQITFDDSRGQENLQLHSRAAQNELRLQRGADPFIQLQSQGHLSLYCTDHLSRLTHDDLSEYIGANEDSQTQGDLEQALMQSFSEGIQGNKTLLTKQTFQAQSEGDTERRVQQQSLWQSEQTTIVRSHPALTLSTLNQQINLSGKQALTLFGQEIIVSQGYGMLRLGEHAVHYTGKNATVISSQKANIKGHRGSLGQHTEVPPPPPTGPRLWVSTLPSHSPPPAAMPQSPPDPTRYLGADPSLPIFHAFQARGKVGASQPPQLSNFCPIPGKQSDGSYNSSEIIMLGQRAIAHPKSSVEVSPQDHHTVQADKPPLKKSDVQVPYQTLMPPIIINYRKASGPHGDGNNRQGKDHKNRLRDDEIQYLKTHGNSVVIFIHGFNVEYGSFAKQVVGAEVVEVADMNEKTESEFLVEVNNLTGGKIPDIIQLDYNDKESTIYQGRDKLSKEFSTFNLNTKTPCLDADPPSDGDDDVVNGTGMHNWVTHIEDNLNRATTQFTRDNYLHFQRCIHITWEGDCGFEDNITDGAMYFEAEEHATQTGKSMLDLISGLVKEKIEINIIAHSMGCRVALTCLENMGKDPQYKEAINHVFLWQAAVNHNALSNDPSKDKSIKQNHQFIHATEAVKKITVLYSKNDSSVLNSSYPFAYAALAKGEELAGGLIGMMLNDPKNSVLPAMGYSGPDMTDKFVNDLSTSNKLILADLTPWGFGHSYMKNPSPDVMKHGYHTFIINRHDWGIDFGSYDKSRFPDDPLPKGAVPEEKGNFS